MRRLIGILLCMAMMVTAISVDVYAGEGNKVKLCCKGVDYILYSGQLFYVDETTGFGEIVNDVVPYGISDLSDSRNLAHYSSYVYLPKDEEEGAEDEFRIIMKNFNLTSEGWKFSGSQTFYYTMMIYGNAILECDGDCSITTDYKNSTTESNNFYGLYAWNDLEVMAYGDSGTPKKLYCQAYAENNTRANNAVGACILGTLTLSYGYMYCGGACSFDSNGTAAYGKAGYPTGLMAGNVEVNIKIGASQANGALVACSGYPGYAASHYDGKGSYVSGNITVSNGRYSSVAYGENNNVTQHLYGIECGGNIVQTGGKLIAGTSGNDDSNISVGLKLSGNLDYSGGYICLESAPYTSTNPNSAALTAGGTVNFDPSGPFYSDYSTSTETVHATSAELPSWSEKKYRKIQIDSLMMEQAENIEKEYDGSPIALEDYISFKMLAPGGSSRQGMNIPYNGNAFTYGISESSLPGTYNLTVSYASSGGSDYVSWSKTIPATIKEVPLYVNGIPVKKSGDSDILGDGTVSYVPSEGTLTLNNTDFTKMCSGTSGGDISAIYTTTDLVVVLVGENSISTGDNASGSSYGIFANGASLTFTGDGSLAVSSGAAKTFSVGICAYDLSFCENVSVLASGNDTSYGSNGSSYGIRTNGSFEASDNAVVSASAGSGSRNSYGIYTGYQLDTPQSFEITDSAFVMTEGGPSGTEGISCGLSVNGLIHTGGRGLEAISYEIAVKLRNATAGFDDMRCIAAVDSGSAYNLVTPGEHDTWYQRIVSAGEIYETDGVITWAHPSMAKTSKCKVLAAQYVGGRMTDVRTFEIDLKTSASPFSVSFSDTDGAIYKLFILSDAGYSPICTLWISD